MKTTLRILLLLATYFTHSQTVQWAVNSPGALGGENHTLATDAQGNVYSVGAYSSSPQDFDPGTGVYNLAAFSQNMFILKVDVDGNFVWAKQIGGTTNYAITEADAITVDASGNIYVAGKLNVIFGTIDCDPGAGTYNLTVPTNKNVDYIEKLDANGNFVWVKTITNPTGTQAGVFDEIQSLKVDAAGYVYATGSFTGTPDFDPDGGVFNLTASKVDIFVLKLDSSGSFVWAKSIPYTGDPGASAIIDSGYGIDVDGAGNVYTVGYFWGAIDADPGAGVHTLTGYLSNNPVESGSNNLYISKLDASGNFVWAYSIAGDHNNGSHPSIALDNGGNVIVSGYLEGGVAVAGNIADFDFGAGTYFLPGTAGSFVLKMDSNAGFIWAKSTVQSTIDITTNSQGNGLVLDSAGNIYTVGAFMSSCDFDPSANTFALTAENLDVYVSKLDTNGNFVWATKLGGSGVEDAYSITLASGHTVIWGNVTSGGFSKSINSVSTGGFLASITQPALGVNQNDISKISLYPNPTQGNLNIDFPNTIHNGTLKIISMTGQIVFKKENVSGANLNLDVSFLSKGVYCIEVDDETFVIKSKLIRQ